MRLLRSRLRPRDAVPRPAREHTPLDPSRFAPLYLALALLVLGVLTDDHDLPLALDDFAFLTHLLNRRTYFHSIITFLSVRIVSLSMATGIYFDRHVIRPFVRS